jgi:hypothetical protein
MPSGLSWETPSGLTLKRRSEMGKKYIWKDKKPYKKPHKEPGVDHRTEAEKEESLERFEKEWDQRTKRGIK